MINIFNRRELAVTFSDEQRQALVNALCAANIKFAQRTRKVRTHGESVESQYVLYVLAVDEDAARAAIERA